jgi:uncharacterized protein DUF6263
MNPVRLVIIALLSLSFVIPVKDIKLEYSFRVGDEYDYVQSSKQSIKQTIAGMGDVNTEIQLDALMSFRVQELTASGARIEAQYRKLKATTNSAIVNINMDSEGSEDSKQNKMIRMMMNKPFFFTLSKTGVVEKVEGVENIYSGLNTLGLDEATLAATKQSLQETISEKSLKTNLEMALINYPDKKLKENDSWQKTSDLVMNFVLKMDNVWSLKKIEDNIASIESDGTLTTPDKEKVITLPNGIKSKTDLSGRQVTVSKVNLSSGWPTEMKILSEIKGKMILLAGGMIPQDMDVPMEMQLESTINIIKKK